MLSWMNVVSLLRTCITSSSCAGVHLEIDPGGANPCVCVHKHTYTREVWGHAPPENFDFRLSKTASGAFSGTLY